ncbi:ParB/Srx family N-terminal domain-containing protein [uncultured Roseovarius sp.]|uniref:ParB/RepB/Spo0J family partition protein n=1 Tax=uncultured Roseovarius sp. TaxID=293344 RepID=UPI002629C378|nr:ParB/Srx family N-terminal domain-containing protein [uncultured Roseovarius sp.]
MTNQTNTTPETAIIYATLDQLYLHDLNPRQDVTEEEITILAESIKVCGLMQNLGGLQDETGKIGIVAGGRRLRALTHLAGSDGDHVALNAIPVRLAKDETQAEMWANAENTARADLDPADEIRAYGRMAERDASAETIASAFGVTVPHVKGRLKLAGLPEAALDALKARQINLTTAQKMTTVNDEKLIFEAIRLIEDGQIDTTRQLDQFLHPKAVTDTDRRAVFVGVEAYEAAGGKITRDLFSEDVFFEDSEILAEAFAAKLDALAKTIQGDQGWAWVETHSESYLGWHFMEERKVARVYPVDGVLSEEQAARYDELAELAEGDVLDAAGEADLEALQIALDGEYTPEQKALAGCVVYVSNGGDVQTCAGLIRPEDKKAAMEAGVLAKSNHGSAAPKNPYSQKLRDDLDAIKLAALQNAMLDQPDLLLDLLGFQLCGMTGYEKVFDVSLGGPTNTPSTGTGFAVDKRLSKPGSAPQDAWNVDLTKAFAGFKKKGKKFRDAEITRQLAILLTGGDEDFAKGLVGKSGAEIRKVWTPTAENFFKRISGPMLEDIYNSLLEIAPAEDRAKSFAKLKKGEKAEALENLISDPMRQKVLGVTDAQKSRIETWVPDYYV